MTIFALIFFTAIVVVSVFLMYFTLAQFYQLILDILNKKNATSAQEVKNSILVPKAYIATTMRKYFKKVDGDTQIYLLGHDIDTFYRGKYRPLYQLVTEWMRQGAQVYYFLHTPPDPDLHDQIQKVLEDKKKAFSKGSGNMQILQINNTPLTKDIIANSATNHFVLVEQRKGDKSNYRLWIEGNHPVGETYALDCEYIRDAHADPRLKTILQDVQAMQQNSTVLARSSEKSMEYPPKPQIHAAFS